MNSKFVLATVSVILVVSLAANAYIFTGSLQNRVRDLESQLTTSSEQINNLQKENYSLQQQLDEAREPKPYLVTRLGAYVHPDRVTIYGEVTNVGAKTAENCRLFVRLYRNETVAIDAFIKLGTIEYWSRTSLRTDIPYSGAPITNWTITPEYD